VARGVVIVALLSSLAPSAKGQRIAATFGTRTPPVTDGHGGTVTVTAPSDLCADNTYEMRVREFSLDRAESLDAVRLPAGPSKCEWRFEGMEANLYDVMILRRADNQIIASSDQIELVPGSSIWLDAQRRAVELEGRILVNGSPHKEAALVVMRSIDRWTVSLDDEGRYRVSVPGAPTALCLRLERADVETIGSPASFLGCQNFLPGNRVFDVDTALPQGLMRVVVPAVAPGRAADWTAPYIQVAAAGGQESGSRSFKITNGFVGEYAWAPLGTYRVHVGSGPSTGTGHRVIAEASVTLDAEHAYAEVTLQVPPGSLGCDDGWWSACPNPPTTAVR
jgi:hypothetical protein